MNACSSSLPEKSQNYNQTKQHRKMKMLLTIAAIASILFVGWGTVRIVKAVSFNQQCGGYLTRAANANTIDLAERELAVAIGHLDRNGIKTGYTSVIYRTPYEDIGYWYDNLSASLMELREIPADASQLERSNVLMKLRETLIDNGSEGDRLTMPLGISVYPSNAAFFWWGWASVIVAGIALGGIVKNEL